MGSAKAWVNFNGSTGAIRTSYNVSSVTRNATGDYTLHFTNALTDANYSAAGMGINGANTWGVSIHASVAPTSSAFRIRGQGDTGFGDGSIVTVSVFR